MYSKVPTYQPTNIPQQQQNQQNNLLNTLLQLQLGQNAVYGQAAINSFQSGQLANQLAKPVVQTLQPVSNLLTIVQSETFWLNALGIAAGLVLVFIAIQFILQYETTNVAKGVVKTAVGKG